MLLVSLASQPRSRRQFYEVSDPLYSIILTGFDTFMVTTNNSDDAHIPELSVIVRSIHRVGYNVIIRYS